MRVLAFDTSTSWCCVAVGDEHGFTQREEAIGQAHSERLLPIACSVAQGLALGLDRPALPVCTLEALAYQLRADHAIDRTLACTDARMGEVYFAAYECADACWREVAPPAVSKPDHVRLPDEGE